MHRFFSSFVLLLASLFITGAASQPATQPANETSMTEPSQPAANVKINISVSANGFERVDRPVCVEVPVSPKQSVKLTEVDSQGNVVEDWLLHQIDAAPPTSAPITGFSTLCFILSGTTAPDATRHFVLQTAGPASVLTQVSVEDNVQDEDQPSFKISTPTVFADASPAHSGATWFYHKEGAAFSSILDKDGNDWLNYNAQPGSGAAGEYRGLPNTGHKEGYMHPGKTMSRSKIVAQGPLRVVIDSESNDGKWAGRWEIYPQYAVFTITKVSHPYWFLYEGTPGGSTETDKDYWVRADGSKGMLTEAFEPKAMDENWVYFADGTIDRSLFLVQNANQSETTSYHLMETMTVFGFGRPKGSRMVLTDVPAQFTVGFAESRDYEQVKKIIQSAYKDLIVEVK